MTPQERRVTCDSPSNSHTLAGRLRVKLLSFLTLRLSLSISPLYCSIGTHVRVLSSLTTFHLLLPLYLRVSLFLLMYERQPSGIGPERVKGLKIDLSRTDTKE